MRKSAKVESVPTPLFENFEYWKIDDVVNFTGLAKKTIYNLCNKREIPYLKQRKKLVFIPQEIRKWYLPKGVA